MITPDAATNTHQTIASTRKAWVSAIVSGVLAFLTSLLTAVQGGSVGWSTITPGQWLTAAIAFVVAFAGTGGLTYAIPNAPPSTNG